MAEPDVSVETSLMNRIDRMMVNNRMYPEPFFDIASTYTPKRINDAFRWGELFFTAVPEVGRICKDLATYPITHVIYRAKDTKVKEVYKNLFDKVLRLRSVLQEIGIDYFLYGNAFLTIYFPSRKYLKCKNCKGESDLEENKYKFENNIFKLNKCPRCGIEKAPADLTEKKTKERHRTRLVRLRPHDIDIQMSSLSGHKRYFYRPDNETKMGVAKGDYFTIANTPLVVIEACKQRKKVELSPDSLYHFMAESPSLQLSRNGWGYPLILNALKSIWHIAILRKANEAIAFDHIVPFRGMCPMPNGSGDAPGKAIELNRFTAFLEKEIKKWRIDPNHIMLSSFPIQEFIMGAQGKALLLNQEIDLERRRIASVWGYPMEMLDGALAFSGAQMAARLMSNRMLNYMEDIKLAMDFFVPKILKYYRIPVFGNAVECAPVKTVDDIQQQQILLQLLDKNIISPVTFAELIGIDISSGETENIIKSIRDQAKIISEQTYLNGIADIVAQAKVSSLQSTGGATMDKIFSGQAQEEIKAQQEQKVMAGQEPMDVDQQSKKIAEDLRRMNKDKRAEAITRLKREYPSFAQRVLSVLDTPPERSENVIDMRKTPEQKPSRRVPFSKD